MTDDSYRIIPLTKGKFAKVDAADYDWLMQWKWQAVWRKGSGRFYASHKGYGSGHTFGCTVSSLVSLRAMVSKQTT